MEKYNIYKMSNNQNENKIKSLLENYDVQEVKISDEIKKENSIEKINKIFFVKCDEVYERNILNDYIFENINTDFEESKKQFLIVIIKMNSNWYWYRKGSSKNVVIDNQKNINFGKYFLERLKMKKITTEESHVTLNILTNEIEKQKNEKKSIPLNYEEFYYEEIKVLINNIEDTHPFNGKNLEVSSGITFLTNKTAKEHGWKFFKELEIFLEFIEKIILEKPQFVFKIKRITNFENIMYDEAKYEYNFLIDDDTKTKWENSGSEIKNISFIFFQEKKNNINYFGGEGKLYKFEYADEDMTDIWKRVKTNDKYNKIIKNLSNLYDNGNEEKFLLKLKEENYKVIHGKYLQDKVSTKKGQVELADFIIDEKDEILLFFVKHKLSASNFGELYNQIKDTHSFIKRTRKNKKEYTEESLQEIQNELDDQKLSNKLVELIRNNPEKIKYIPLFLVDRKTQPKRNSRAITAIDTANKYFGIEKAIILEKIAT